MRLFAAALVLLAGTLAASCVRWPEGTGPGAQPLGFDDAVARQGRGEAVLVDVRSRESFAAAHVPGAINVPIDEVETRAEELRRLGKLPIFYCGCPHEETSGRAAHLLHERGIDARVLQGGVRAWQGHAWTGGPAQ